MRTFLQDFYLTFYAPRAVARKQLARGVSEPGLLAMVGLASLLAFFIALPNLTSRYSDLDSGETSIQGFLGAFLVAYLLFGPLFLYGIAALARICAHLFGGRGSWHSARLALFWALLVMQPIVLLVRLVADNSPAVGVSAFLPPVSGVIFLTIWLMRMYAFEFETR